MAHAEPERLEQQLQDLAERVARLERFNGLSPQPASTVPAAAIPAGHPLEHVPNLLPIVGRALLGLAGAYLLRALTEARTLPPRVGMVAGIVYALFWLGWAARRPADERMPTAIDSLTAVLILSPLLWEACDRFHLLGAWTAAAALAVFAVFGMLISWRKNLLVVSTFATVAALATGAALMVATREVLPYTLLFLAIAAAIEFSACFDHWLSERWFVALAADLAVVVAAYTHAPASGLLAAQAGLLAVYLASVIFRTLWRGYSITVFETAQCAAAFAIGRSGGLLLICAAACYLASFALLERPKTSSRNFYTYSTCAIVLAVVGSRLLLAGDAAAWTWSALAVACIWAGGFFGRLTLQVHGVIYLWLALATSGAFANGAAVLLGEAACSRDLLAGLITGGLAYGLIGKAPAVWRTAVAAAFTWTGAAVAAGVFTTIVNAPQAYDATIRTGIVGALALVLAWAGTRWKRPELALLVYPVMLLAGYRLFVSSLHQTDKLALFLSLLLLGGVLTALPRVKRS